MADGTETAVIITSHLSRYWGTSLPGRCPWVAVFTDSGLYSGPPERLLKSIKIARNGPSPTTSLSAWSCPLASFGPGPRAIAKESY